MIKILCVLSLLSILLISCGIEKDLVIDSFSDFPDEIDGCACYFSANKKDFIQGNYIYADNYHNHAYISINGVMELFTLINHTDTPDGFWTRKYSNKEYNVTIEGHEIWQVDQTWQEKGTLSIKSKDGKTIKETIFGECGC